MKPFRIMAFIPAHNEESVVASAIKSIQNQVDRIIVVSDNSTDRTTEVATTHGAEVFETIDNQHKKAGALNQALDFLLPEMRDEDYVFILDADTTVSPRFMERALPLFNNPKIGAVGGVFEGEYPTSILSRLNRNEFARYVRQIDRTRRTMVLSGTSSLIKVSVLKKVAELRGSTLPGTKGQYYDLQSITEDNELSVAIRTLGYIIASPKECTVHTELMQTIPELHRQRVRWYRGAMENLLSYGLTKVTARYWFQQVMLLWGLLMFTLLTFLLLVTITTGSWEVGALGLIITAVFSITSTITVSHSTLPDGKRDTKSILLACILIPELLYSYLLFGAFAHALFSVVFKTNHQWAHVER